MYNGSSANGGRDTYFKHRYAFNKYTNNIIPIILDKEYMSNDYDIFTTFIATGTPVTKQDGTTSDGSAGTGRIQIHIKPPLYTEQPKIYSKVFVDIFTNDDNDFDVTSTNVTIGNSNTDITDENPLVNYIAGAGWNAPNKTVFGGYVGIGTEPINNARLQVHDGGFSVTGYSDQGRNLYTSTTPGVHIATYGNNSSPHGFIELVSAGESGSWIDFKDNTNNNTNTDYEGRIRYASGGSLSGMSLYTNSTEKMRIATNGNVGIGTTTPSEKLVVNGTTKATEFVGNGVTPIGGIIMWSGNMDSSGSPEGYSNWKICNGTSHTVQGNVINTPNLQDRFIVGSGSTYSIGNTGGVNSVTLSTSEIPSHSHSMNNSGAHLHEINNAGNNNNKEAIYSYFTNNGGRGNADIGGSHGGNNEFDLAFNGYSNHKQNSGAHTHTINSTGGGSSHENRPPYYALAFIMRIY